MSRHAGLLVPLFSLTSSASWGIGEFPDLVPLADWMTSAGLDRLMLLPLGTMPEGEHSPYSAASAMALDPIYVAVTHLEDFHLAGGLDALASSTRAHLETAARAPSLRYDIVRRVKTAAIDLAFARFIEHEWSTGSERAHALAAFVTREAWWLDDYALFQALKFEWPGVSWRRWPEPIRDRHPDAVGDACQRLARPILREQFAQWVAEEQWQAARAALTSRGVAVCGDLQFVVALESADVWARASEYLLDVTVGAPPDAFSETGQDWKLPGYRWDVIAAGGYEPVRMRARRMAALFDGVRIDHLVGLYRTYYRPENGDPFFFPRDEAEQLAQGEAILRLFQQSGAWLLAEDLGTVPDFVRASMASLGVPGTKVPRWERAWFEPGQPFIDPRAYPEASVTMTGTHDTETLASWWEHVSPEDRQAVLQVPELRDLGIDAHDPWSDRLRDALLAMAWRSASADLFVPFQDLFGWRDRINVPGTVNDRNWTWRMPWPVDRLVHEPAAVTRAHALRTLSRAAARCAIPV